jgi:hypothetical protein
MRSRMAIGEGRLADQDMPAIDRNLTGDRGGAAAATVFDNLKNVMALLGSKRLESPIIEDQGA